MLLLLAALAHAQVTPIAPFTGERSEGFEGYDQTGAAIPCLDDVFDGAASLCAPDANVGGVQVRDQLFLGCLLTARSGERLAGSNDGPSELTFDRAIARFGGYFGTHAPAGDLTVELYGFDGALLHRDTLALPGGCSWTWRGYEATDTPIWRARFVHSNNAGALIDLDDLVADPACDDNDLDCDGATADVDCDDRDPRRAPTLPEICDGVDNDCDGQVDEGLVPPPVGTGLGVCADLTPTCEGEDGWVEPDDWGSRVDWEPVETTCDGLDNDCDGRVDADLVAPPADPEGPCPDLAPRCEGGVWVEPVAADCDAEDPEVPTARCATGSAAPHAGLGLLALLLGIRRSAAGSRATRARPRGRTRG